jgi:aldose sugar dehydrogenase
MRIVNGTLLSEPLLDVNVAAQAHRGMLGIAVVTLHPPQPTSSKHENVVNSHNSSTTTSAYVFLYYTEAATKDGDDITEGKQPLGNRLFRYEMVNKLVNPKLLRSSSNAWSYKKWRQDRHWAR